MHLSLSLYIYTYVTGRCRDTHIIIYTLCSLNDFWKLHSNNLRQCLAMQRPAILAKLESVPVTDILHNISPFCFVRAIRVSCTTSVSC